MGRKDLAEPPHAARRNLSQTNKVSLSAFVNNKDIFNIFGVADAANRTRVENAN